MQRLNCTNFGFYLQLLFPFFFFFFVFIFSFDFCVSKKLVSTFNIFFIVNL